MRKAITLLTALVIIAIVSCKKEPSAVVVPEPTGIYHFTGKLNGDPLVIRTNDTGFYVANSRGIDGLIRATRNSFPYFSVSFRSYYSLNNDSILALSGRSFQLDDTTSPSTFLTYNTDDKGGRYSSRFSPGTLTIDSISRVAKDLYDMYDVYLVKGHCEGKLSNGLTTFDLTDGNFWFPFVQLN